MNNKKYIIAVAVIVFISIFMFMMTDYLQKNIENFNTYFPDDAGSNFINQLFSIIVLYISGLILLVPFSSKMNSNLMLILSPIIGLLAFEFISIFLLLGHIYYSIISVLIVYILVVSIIYFSVLRKDRLAIALSLADVKNIAFWSVIIIAIGFTLTKIPFNILSFDSVQYKLLGETFAREHYIADYTHFQFGGHAFVPSLLSSIAYFFNFDFAYAIQNTFMVMCMLLYGYIIYDEVKQKDFGTKKTIVLSLIPTLIFCTSFFVVFLAICLIPNMFAGFFLFFFVYYMNKYLSSKNMLNLGLSFIFMIALVFTRVEGSLMIAFILAYVAHKGFNVNVLLKYIGGLLAILLFWYTSFFMHVGFSFESDFLTVDKCSLIVGILIVIGVYAKLKDKCFKQYNDKLLNLYYIALIIFTLALSFLDLDKFTTNISTLYINMFAQGRWITEWFAVCIFTAISILISKKKDKFNEGIIFIYLVVMIAVFALRATSLHTNWGDSGNRLLMHIYPLIVYTIFDNIISFFQTDKI